MDNASAQTLFNSFKLSTEEKSDKQDGNKVEQHADLWGAHTPPDCNFLSNIKTLLMDSFIQSALWYHGCV